MSNRFWEEWSQPNAMAERRKGRKNGCREKEGMVRWRKRRIGLQVRVLNPRTENQQVSSSGLSNECHTYDSLVHNSIKKRNWVVEDGNSVENRAMRCLSGKTDRWFLSSYRLPYVAFAIELLISAEKDIVETFLTRDGIPRNSSKTPAGGVGAS